MSIPSEVVSAVIGAAVTVLVFVGSQVWTGRRERGVRMAEQRHANLAAAQEAALTLRNQLGEFGPLARRASGSVPGEDLVLAQQQADDALAELDVRVSRLDDDGVVGAVLAWRERARYHYISAEEVTAADEQALWAAMNEVFGAALQASTGRR